MSQTFREKIEKENIEFKEELRKAYEYILWLINHGIGENQCTKFTQNTFNKDTCMNRCEKRAQCDLHQKICKEEKEISAINEKIKRNEEVLKKDEQYL